MATASTMILSALRMIGEKTPGGTLSSAEQTDYLYDLNALMEMWSLDGLLIYHLLDGTKALTSGDGTYTIGSGGDINAALNRLRTEVDRIRIEHLGTGAPIIHAELKAHLDSF